MYLPKTLVAAVSAAALGFSVFGSADDWTHYGSDLSSTKYAAFDQINHDNVADLEQVWQWQSPDNATVAAITLQRITAPPRRLSKPRQ
ncbi:MAG: hypothetical protein WD600_01645 [Pseudohongiella sp.]